MFVCCQEVKQCDHYPMVLINSRPYLRSNRSHAHYPIAAFNGCIYDAGNRIRARGIPITYHTASIEGEPAVVQAQHRGPGRHPFG